MANSNLSEYLMMHDLAMQRGIELEALQSENADLKTVIHTLTEERDTAEAKLTAIAAIERLSEDYTLHEWQHHAGFNDCLDIVHDIAEVNPATTTTPPPASG